MEAEAVNGDGGCGELALLVLRLWRSRATVQMSLTRSTLGPR